MSHSITRIGPGISEIFFLVVTWFSIRQFLSLLFILVGWFVWYVKLHGWKQLKTTVANVGRAWFSSALVSLQQGDSEATGTARLIWSRGRTRPDGGMLGQLFACCQHTDVSPAVLSQRRAELAQGSGHWCLAGHRLPTQREVDIFPLSTKLPFGVPVSDTH